MFPSTILLPARKTRGWTGVFQEGFSSREGRCVKRVIEAISRIVGDLFAFFWRNEGQDLLLTLPVQVSDLMRAQPPEGLTPPAFPS